MPEPSVADASLRDTAYALTRELAASSGGVALSRLLADLRAPFDARLATWTGRGTFQFAATRRAPGLAGYAAAACGVEPVAGGVALGLGRERDDASPLDSSEAALLVGTQWQLTEIMRLGLAPLLEVFPAAWLLVDPGRYSPRRPPAVARAPEAVNSDVWTPGVSGRLVKALRAHPAAAALLALGRRAECRALLLPEGVPDAWRDMERLRRALWYEGARGVPELWKHHMYLLPPGSFARNVFRVAAALLALRRSLMILNQLVFQKVIGLKPVVTDDIVVSVLHKGWTEVGGRGAVVRLIPPKRRGERLGNDEEEFLAWVTATGIVPGRGTLVEATFHTGSSGPYGEIHEFDVRAVDEHLNSYPGLLSDPLARFE